MPTQDDFATIRIPQGVRKKLRILAAQRDQHMYELVAEWLAQDEQRSKDTTHEIPSCVSEESPDAH